MTKRSRSQEITPLQFGTLLDEASKIDPKMPFKLILTISPYKRETIELIQKHGFELDFEMPLQKKICGSIEANRGKMLRQLHKQRRVLNIEICGMSSVETM